MKNAGEEPFDGEIVGYLRSKCIGFQRGETGLVTVIESLVRTNEDVATVIYQLRSADGKSDRVLRRRPRIDIPAPGGLE